MSQLPGEAEEKGFVEFRRKVRAAEVLSAAMERLLTQVQFKGRASVVVHNGRVLNAFASPGIAGVRAARVSAAEKRIHSVRSLKMKSISWRLPQLGFSAALERQARTLKSTPWFAGQAATTRTRHGNLRMDMTWVTGRIALGGGIWSADNMAAVSRAGITHIIDMQIEFDDTPLAEPHGIEVLWNPTDDDFQIKPPELFQRGIEYAQQALENDEARLFIHCAAGVHRAPMMTLAVLCTQGWDLETAVATISSRRPLADFAEVYVKSVERFLQQQETQEISNPFIE